MNFAIQKSSPVVSWLLCTNRVDNLLWRAIDSCLSQTFTDFELLIIANGPQAELLAEQVNAHYIDDVRVRVVTSDVQMLNFNLSLGVWSAKGRYIARMDGDDVAVPERLALQVSFMDAHPDVIVLGSSYELIDANNQILGRVNLPCTDSEIRNLLITSNPFCHPSVMLRRKAIADGGAYLGGRNAEDYDLWCRLSLQHTEAAIFANLKDPLVRYNIDPFGAARRSREAYSNVVACQVRTFLVTGHWRWLMGAIINIGKLLFRSRRQ